MKERKTSYFFLFIYPLVCLCGGLEKKQEDWREERRGVGGKKKTLFLFKKCEKNDNDNEDVAPILTYLLLSIFSPSHIKKLMFIFGPFSLPGRVIDANK